MISWGLSPDNIPSVFLYGEFKGEGHLSVTWWDYQYNLDVISNLAKSWKQILNIFFLFYFTLNKYISRISEGTITCDKK